MKNVLLIGYELLAVVLPAVLMNLFFRAVRKKRGTETNRQHLVYMLIFVFYLFSVLHVTGAGTVYNAKRYGLEIKPEQINAIPFSDPDMDLAAYGLNVILFVPLGFLLSLIQPEKKRRSILTASFVFSLAVELSQLLNNRRTDTDDLILNTAGAIAGAALYALLFRRKTGADAVQPGLNGEAYLCMGILFVSRFLLFDEFHAAKLLFGF